jgi:hypothetical protein
MVHRRGRYNVLVRKPERKTQLERTKPRREDKIKTYLQKI